MPNLRHGPRRGLRCVSSLRLPYFKEACDYLKGSIQVPFAGGTDSHSVKSRWKSQLRSPVCRLSNSRCTVHTVLWFLYAENLCCSNVLLMRSIIFADHIRVKRLWLALNKFCLWRQLCIGVWSSDPNIWTFTETTHTLWLSECEPPTHSAEHSRIERSRYLHQTTKDRNSRGLNTWVPKPERNLGPENPLETRKKVRFLFGPSFVYPSVVALKSRDWIMIKL